MRGQGPAKPGDAAGDVGPPRCSSWVCCLGVGGGVLNFKVPRVVYQCIVKWPLCSLK